MNEQDFIHTIENQTKDLPIPDSISPDSMKKMLDNHITTDSITDTPASGDTGRRRRNIRRYTAAACVVLFLAGALSISSLLSDTGNTADTTHQNASVSTESEASQEDAAEDFSEDLAYQTNLATPDSYDDYYDALKNAYDAYYDSISTVETETGALFDGVLEAANETAAEASIEDNASTNSLRSSDATKQSADSGENNGNYSTTNTQEKEVDEGDIIKTDGTYIYRVSQS